MTVGDAVKRYNEMVSFVKTIMKSGQDYGVIPGTDKPTLLKPGAEKLCTFFGYTFEPELVERVEDWQKPFFYYRYRAVLKDKTGRVIAVGEASINSMESKYRWRNVPSWKATPEEKRDGVPSQRKSKDGRMLTFYRVPNDDIYSQVNSMQKICQKRTLTQVVLLGCNASEFFTQDLEDIVDAAYVEVEVPAVKVEASPVLPAPQAAEEPEAVIARQLAERQAAKRTVEGKAERPPEPPKVVDGRMSREDAIEQYGVLQRYAVELGLPVDHDLVEGWRKPPFTTERLEGLRMALEKQAEAKQSSLAEAEPPIEEEEQ
jgi:hypothetical protein